MEGTSPLFTANALASSLIVSHDGSLVEEIRSALGEGIAARAVGSFREAEVLLESWRPAAVVVDLRRATAGENPAPLLQQLGKRENRRTPMLAVSDCGYVCDWAALADLVFHGHLQLPLDRGQLAAMLQKARIAHPAGPFSPRSVQGRSVTFRTYTAEMFGLLDEVAMIAGHEVTVLLVGETGTGKTTLARLIHELSTRHEGRLLPVACGALPPDLIESELFGHVKGAFTSADHTRQGKFEAAAEGTLLLDEIDVLGPAQQTRLLRVIETGEFEPVGSNETRHSKARLIVASNVELKDLMERGQFRADLYYRLSMLELRLLPLRERPRDIVPLALDFVEEFCNAHQVLIRRVHPDFLACLKNYAWPGNVRELKNHVRRAVLFCRSGVLTPDELAPQFQRAWESSVSIPVTPTPVPAMVANGAQTLVEKMATNERDLLEQALRDNNFNRTATAAALGLSRVGLYKKMKKHGLSERRPR